MTKKRVKRIYRRRGEKRNSSGNVEVGGGGRGKSTAVCRTFLGGGFTKGRHQVGGGKQSVLGTPPPSRFKKKKKGGSNSERRTRRKKKNGGEMNGLGGATQIRGTPSQNRRKGFAVSMKEKKIIKKHKEGGKNDSHPKKNKKEGHKLTFTQKTNHRGTKNNKIKEQRCHIQ